ncbi:MAG: B12-binding domain-containing radical SAM protein [Candidatus Eisenbacteria bacterium]|nr:B12-binding domain-containing radical SAM protein [Candidatus Eisenbacteria bacterium]
MRIGLIALSGVRAADPELTKLGLTLPGFVERSQVIASLPSLSLLTLAALTPPEIEVAYHEVPDLRAQDELPDGFDLVALASYSGQIRDAYELAGRYRARGVPVVMGGPHVTALPEEARAHGATAVVGEGELTWPLLIEDFRRGHLRDEYRPAPGQSYDLADAPLPRYELLDPARYNRLTVQTARGCPHRCEFCASSVILTTRYALKPVPRVIAEIRRIKEIWPHPFIEFADDNSFAIHRHARELLRALEGERIKWFTEADISIAEDPELLELMRRSGCRQVLIGLESPTTAGLDGLELKSNWKLAKQRDYEAAIRTIQAHGVTVNGCFVLGLDGHTEDVFDAVYDFVERTGLFEVQITVLTPFPGTPLYARLRAEGRLLADGDWDRCTLFDVNHVPTHMTPERLRQGLVDLGRRLYDRDFIEARRARFFRELRRSVRTTPQPEDLS